MKTLLALFLLTTGAARAEWGDEYRTQESLARRNGNPPSRLSDRIWAPPSSSNGPSGYYRDHGIYMPADASGGPDVNHMQVIDTWGSNR